MHAKIILSDILTLHPSHPRASGVLVIENRVQALGSREELLAFAPKAEILDFRDFVLTPGLTDAHIHLVGYGLSLQNVMLKDTRSVAEAVSRVSERVARVGAGDWILGNGFDRSLWGQSDYPTALDLDPVSPNHPVALWSRDGHGLWCNSLALQIAGISSSSSNPDGGVIVRDERGEPTGMLLENAMELVKRVFPIQQLEDLVAAAKLGAQDMAHRGFTCVHTMALEPIEYLHAMWELEERGEMPLRIWATISHSQLEHVKLSGLRGGVGDRVKLCGIKFFADGALGSRTALMLEPYLGFSDSGVQVDSKETFLERGRLALELGFSPVVHAIGDRAIREMLDVLEELMPLAREKNVRLRLEHAQHLHPDDIARFGKLGIVASVQPIHAPGDVSNIQKLLGDSRGKTTYAFRSLLETGAVLALGSDAPVATPDPILGFQAAVKRLDLEGQPWNSEQALSRLETLKGYTTGAAFAAGWEGWYGQVAPGFAADFTLWDSDPTLTDAKPVRALIA
jgi:predicted amidohydrolase YtcJ